MRSKHRRETATMDIQQQMALELTFSNLRSVFARYFATAIGSKFHVMFTEPMTSLFSWLDNFAPFFDLFSSMRSYRLEEWWIIYIKSQFPEKNAIEKFPFLVLARYTTMLQHLSIHFSPHYLSSGRLRRRLKTGKCQTFSFKSGRGRLREVVAYKRFQI